MGIEPAGLVDIQTGGWSSTNAVKFQTDSHGRPAAILVMVLLTAFHVLLGDRYWSPVRNFVFDAYQRTIPRLVERLPVVVVDIDDASLAALGQWPWPRTRLARLIEATRQLGALAVGLDLIMPEADRLSPSLFLSDRPNVSQALRDELAKLPSNDAILAETLRRVPSVIGRAGVMESGGDSSRLYAQTPVRVHGGRPMSSVQAFTGHLTNIPQIEDAAFGRGYLNATLDEDGVVRVMPLLFSVNGELAPTFALELLRVAAGENWYSVHASPGGVRGVQIGRSFIPTDPGGRIRLYYSRADPRRRISALTILNGEAGADALLNQVAIIGVTALGLTDTVATPVASLMDGVEFHAQVIENILEGTRLVRPYATHWLELMGFLVVAAALITLFPRLRPGHSVAIFILAVAVLFTISMVLFVHSKLLFDPSFPTAGNTVVLVVLLTAAFAAVDRRRRELRAALAAESAERIRTSGELRAARDIQMGILPAPGAIEGLPNNIEFHAILEPAHEVGGDLYDAFMIDEHRFFFLIGDVSGKGVPASLFMALSKALCKSTALRNPVPLDEMMIVVNKEISRENPARLFVTAVAGVIDVRSGEMQLCSAGHDAPILLREGKAPCSLESVGGPPLCVLDDFPYSLDLFRLQSNDILVMITDGVTEAHDPQQNLYGHERALQYFTVMHKGGNGSQSAKAACRGLYKDVKIFVKGAAPYDDITIMAIQFTDPNPSTPAAKFR